MFSLASASASTSATRFVPFLARGKSHITPKNISKNKVRPFKGRTPVPIGGSTKGTTLAFGDYGIRIKGNGGRLSAQQLSVADEILRRKLKIFKGAKWWLRVICDRAICTKGNETRMGKGKGSFEYWGCWAKSGKVIFEIGGVPIQIELAKNILRQVADRLPFTYEFITKQTPAKLGRVPILTSVPPTHPGLSVRPIPEAVPEQAQHRI